MATDKDSKSPRTDAAQNRPKDKATAMGARNNYVAVARGRDLIVIRIVGRGTMLNAPALQEFADEQRKAGFLHFLFDFERCNGLDSTFMGVMVGMYSPSESSTPMPSSGPALVGMEIPLPFSASQPADDLEPMSPEEALAQMAHEGIGAPARKESRGSTVSAVNAAGDIRSLLSMLGVDKFVKLRGSCDLSKLETTILPEKAISPLERHQLIFKAHELLVEIDKRNEAQFGDLLKTLSEELAGK